MQHGKNRRLRPTRQSGDIDKFEAGTISEGELTRLKENIAQMRAEIEEERRDTDSTTSSDTRKKNGEAKEELKELKQGRKAYPKELEEARLELQNRLQENCGKFVSVQILADLLEIRDERWHNAVEGYMGNNKLLLIVEPKYAKAAMDIYQEMDKKKILPCCNSGYGKGYGRRAHCPAGRSCRRSKSKRKIRAVLHQFLSW